MPTTSPFITRVVVENYKSIASCDVRLGPLNVLVGLNGSGKSNFLDALRFVRDACNTPLGVAVQERGGIDAIRHRPSDPETSIGLRLEFRLPHGPTGHYAFRMHVRESGGYSVQEEECVVDRHEGGLLPAYFKVRNGKYDANTAIRMSGLQQSIPPNNLLLTFLTSGGVDNAIFTDFGRALGLMRFYDINPARMRRLIELEIDSDVALNPDGGNIINVLQHMVMENESAKERIDEYMARVAPNVRAIQARPIADQAILQFRQTADAASEHFFGPAMSNGTLRALGVLVALFQSTNDAAIPVPLIAIEEPEAALHPAAVRVLFDAMREASATSQVIATSHSPDLLEYESLDADSILPVTFDDGATRIGHLNEFGRSAIRDHLFTAGELLRMEQLEPDVAPANGRDGQRVALFDRV